MNTNKLNSIFSINDILLEDDQLVEILGGKAADGWAGTGCGMNCGASCGDTCTGTCPGQPTEPTEPTQQV